ncbi:hypothetical protein Afil01_44400 [Actinorhabdospora filicis]|uniref:Uncharacterized protein n=1 Tax=Actinorhabdospora filicis TaxID=1785913 RepID=A0A9W6SPA4_9ACTN|nr:hypothetical protein [Actinorhabdospora filicis]GLZ79633.1 hypothetical protein Afil01_44400 [Actinorhabdospora filicis]
MISKFNAIADKITERFAPKARAAAACAPWCEPRGKCTADGSWLRTCCKYEDCTYRCGCTPAE